MEADLRKTSPRAVALTVGALLATCAVALGGPARAAAGGGGPGASAVCLDCHDEQNAALARGPHQVLVGANGDEPTRVSCTSCHAGSARHYEDDPEAYPMSNPADLDGKATAAVCAACHQGIHQVNQQTLSPHQAGGVTCLDCHRVHAAGVDRGQLKQPQPGLCYGCHPGVRGQFAQPYQHPVEQRVVACTDCHLTCDDDMAQLTMYGVNAICARCHAQFQGPFPYEHQAAVEFSTEEGGCLNCHQAHGSPLPRLLKQPYEAPHFQLCTQCHLVPARHNFNAQHGSEFAGISCAECHTDIHGSYTNRFYLTPALAAQGCLAVGCHGQ